MGCFPLSKNYGGVPVHLEGLVETGIQNWYSLIASVLR